MTGIRPYFIESSSVVGSILCQARKEILWESAMTIGTLDTGIRLWLARKGIGDDDDIHKIKLLGGSLTHGLLIALYALPRRNADEQVKPPPLSLLSPISSQRDLARLLASGPELQQLGGFPMSHAWDIMLLSRSLLAEYIPKRVLTVPYKRELALVHFPVTQMVYCTRANALQ